MPHKYPKPHPAARLAPKISANSDKLLRTIPHWNKKVFLSVSQTVLFHSASHKPQALYDSVAAVLHQSGKLCRPDTKYLPTKEIDFSLQQSNGHFPTVAWQTYTKKQMHGYLSTDENHQ